MLPATMIAVQLTGHGGPENLVYNEAVPVPQPGPDDVLIRVTAAGINNTDINTRIGWYSKTGKADDAAWTGTPLALPRIQGADGSGRIVAVGKNMPASRIGERVIVRTMMPGATPYDLVTLGSELDGAFAQYLCVPAAHAFKVECDWSDVELAAIPCAYSTAENLLTRADVKAERVLITGASGGVGTAAVQLAKRRGAQVITICSADKAADLKALGADRTIARDADLTAILGHDSVDVVIDVVAGPQFPALLDVLRRGGRYAVSGAIAGPHVSLDVRTLYLKDLTLIGCTLQSDAVFRNLVTYIERGEFRPRIARLYPLRDIARAQADFLSKGFTGKLVLEIP
jgi:NADPH:quinone reductase-like Zn-dependent oxidoreductase